MLYEWGLAMKLLTYEWRLVTKDNDQRCGWTWTWETAYEPHYSDAQVTRAIERLEAEAAAAHARWAAGPRLRGIGYVAPHRNVQVYECTRVDAPLKTGPDLDREFVLVQEPPLHPVWKASDGLSCSEVSAFLLRDDLPADMSLSLGGGLYLFRTTAERFQFALGLQVQLHRR